MPELAEIVRSRTAPCRQVADALPRLAAGDDGVDEAAADHVGQCLRCQAEMAAYRKVLRHMRTLRHEVVPPPPGALAAVLAALEAAAAEHQGSPSWAVRAAYVGGITVATAAAGAAGVLVWMSRRRLGLAQAG